MIRTTNCPSGMDSWIFLFVKILAVCTVASGLVHGRASPDNVQPSVDGVTYQLGNVTYFANFRHPKASFPINVTRTGSQFVPVTVIETNQSVVTGEYLKSTVSRYSSEDDVFSPDFLHALYITSSIPNSRLDQTAQQYLQDIGAGRVYLNASAFRQIPPHAQALRSTRGTSLPPGPYTALLNTNSISFLNTYRLYNDEYRTFITGVYHSNDGDETFAALPAMDPRLWGPLIPVPSRIHSWADPRPLAGKRVAVKDLFDMKGLQTSAGSHAWVQVTPIANATAPAIQRLVDLGAVLVGKYKLAQFASGADPWTWVDEQAPFNPRGDGYLTCSASSSGGGCGVAAYDWLDAAIGTDTGSSIRRPAAVSGTFGNRPSQGMMSVEGAVPLNAAQDTVGLFARDPVEWADFAKAWYTPRLHEDPSVNSLPPLSVPDSVAFPKKILYPVEYLPLVSPAAQAILDDFLSGMTRVLGITIEHTNFTATVNNASIYPEVDENWYPVANWDIIYNASQTLNAWTQYTKVYGPFLRTWAERNDGRFPPVDPQWRASWTQFDISYINQTVYNQALARKAAAVNWFQKEVLYETPDSCCESLMICDGGTGGLPSYREQDLNKSPNASFLGVFPKNADVSCSNICPLFGCVDFTIPLGQVEYQSPITRVREQWPVTINIIARRGCDFMLFNLVKKLAEEGVLRTVKTGRTPF
ncbi:amidase family protein [Aspergillus clavatus NRRL 1]|uniref:Amidase family protein n=1 Tax=Aspergillus clavatus (strain ATCC 1007 / CBS 513.65 / DSM 816 / NCTC 3887 / NRRL 1 / QM 1276 / 107) TaxID=344612 RepID=A1CFM5_ASPCL|nr:amidase family protein [Aspergillus clavatus NRRL 1]EAW11674.1 amidase family protein [Aspergillus clavatus NRRL 1]